jgi:hypothetical protein
VAQSAGLCPVYPAGIGPGQADAGAAAGQIPYQRPGGVAVLDRGRSDHDGDTSPIVSTAMKRTWRERVGLAVVLAGAAAGYSGTAGRRSPEGTVRGSRRAVGLASEGRGESCRATTRLPWSPAVYGESSWPLFPFGCSRPVLAVHGPGPPGWRAEGAPLKPVQKVATSESEQGEPGRTGQAIH